MREPWGLEGPSEMGDADLIRLVIGSAATNGWSTSAALLERFDGPFGISRAAPAELAEVAGVGPVRSIRLLAAIELGRRATRPRPASGVVVLNSSDAYRVLAPGLQHLAVEELHGIYMDRRRRILRTQRLSRGTDGYTVLDPRQVFRPAIGLGAAYVVLAHNHPSGDPTPSRQDQDVTRKIAQAGRILGIELADHLVIGADRYVSLAKYCELLLQQPQVLYEPRD